MRQPGAESAEAQRDRPRAGEDGGGEDDGSEDGDGDEDEMRRTQPGKSSPREHVVKLAHPAALDAGASSLLSERHPDEEQSRAEAGADEQSVIGNSSCGFQDGVQVLADRCEPLPEVIEPLASDQLALGRMEYRVEFDDVPFDSAGHRPDLADEPGSVRVAAEMDDDIDAHSDGRDDEG